MVVRRVLRDRRGVSGGPAYTDVLGVLERWEGQHVVVRHKDGDAVRIALDDVVAAKTVPPPPRRRPR